MTLMRLRRIVLLLSYTAIIVGFFFPFTVAAAPPAPRTGLVFESEADPQFVLRLSFGLKKPEGSTGIYFEGAAKGRGQRLNLTQNAITLSETGAVEKRVAVAPVRFAAQNSMLITRREKLLRVALNGRIVLDTTQAMPEISRIAIYDPGARLQMLQEPRYQPTEEIYLTDDFMVAEGATAENAHWQPISGTWHVAGVAKPQGAADPFKFTGFAAGKTPAGVAINRDSRWFWSDYQVSVSSRLLDDKASMGLVFGYQGPQEYSGLSWSGTNSSDGGRLRLWQRRGSQTVTLAERPARAISGQWYRLAVAMQGKQLVAYVDENPVLKATNDALIGGQCGLFTAGEAGAEFDDVRVQSVTSTALAPATRPESGEPWQTRRFATDPFMAAWGDAGSDWELLNADDAKIETKRFQHRGHFFDPIDITVALPALRQNEKDGSTPVAANTPATTGAEFQELVIFGGEDATSGYRVQLSDNAPVLLKNGRSVAVAPKASLPKDKSPAALQVKVHNGHITVLLDDREVLHYADSTPLRAGRVALVLKAASPAAGASAWKTFGGTVAGAVRIESQAVQEYRFDSAPIDWKIESGTWQSTTRWACVPEWNFFGGWGEPVATIWNKRHFGGDMWFDIFVAPREGTSDRMHFSFPVNLNVTFGAQGEKRDTGYTLVFRSHDQSTMLFRAGKMVAEVKDLVLQDWRNNEMFVYYRLSQTWQHLQILKRGGHIQVWVEIPAQNYEPLKRRLLLDYTDPAPLQGDRFALWTWGRNGMSVARIHAAASRVGLPVADFLEVKKEVSSATRRVNDINGGSFRTDLISKPVQPNELPVVSFDYRHSPSTALALYAVAGGQRFRADFIGRVTQDGDSVAMGAVTRSELDKARTQQGWKHATFALQQALREFFPTGALPRIEELYVADLSTLPEHIGGLEANAKGAVFEWRPSVAVPPAIAASQIVPDEARSSPATGMLRLKAMSQWVDPAEYSVAVNEHSLPWGSPGILWHSAQREITVDLAAAGLAFDDNQKVRVTFTPQSGASKIAHGWTYHIADDKTPPAAPAVSSIQGPDRVDTFETDTGDWQRLGGEQGATLWRDATTAASGKYSLRLFHRQLSGTFGAQITDKPFDARRFPLATFDYQMKPEVQLSLICEIAGKWYEFRFSDVNRTFRTVGQIQNVTKDGQWHQATIDLLGAVRRSGTGATVISRLFFADTGYMNNLQDTFWHIDNFRFVPALPVGEANALRWKSNDLSGIAGYSWIVDNAAETVPDEVAEAEAPGAAIAAGTSYLHVRAKDRAGNWGPTTHFRFEVLPASELSTADVRPVVKAAPLTEQRLNAPAIEVQLGGANLIDPASLRLSVEADRVQRREYNLTSDKLSFDNSTGVLRWRDGTILPRDNNPYSLSVSMTARDLLGRQVLQQKWEWTVNPHLDTNGPPAPFVSYIPTNRLARYDFENRPSLPDLAPSATTEPRGRALGAGDIPSDVQLRRSAWVLHDGATGSTGQASARVVNLNGEEFFSTFLKKTPYSVSRYPQVSFDYRFEPGRYNLNLVAAVNGDLQTVKMTDSPDAYYAFTESKIGTLIDFRTDGEWHNATFDFGAMLRKRYPTAPRFFAEYVGTWATGASGYENPQGASMWLDNITFFSTNASSASFEWQPPSDDNGIRGYSYVLDGQPSTLPAEKVMTTTTHYEAKALKPGKWYFHVRACDGAGNWGPAVHVPFELTGEG